MVQESQTSRGRGQAEQPEIESAIDEARSAAAAQGAADMPQAERRMAPPPLPGTGAEPPRHAAPGGPAPAPKPSRPTKDQTRRSAQRRPAGAKRDERKPANDDSPSIGGLIYSLQQKPSDKPYRVAGIATGVWILVWLVFAWLSLSSEMKGGASLLGALATGQAFLLAAAVVVPTAVFWFLAVLAVRAEELRLRSSTMTEVAVRLAEPDRMAEQSIASLGQAVRRQVSFMNDAVSRALGRAGELEALVHNEVSALERSYEDNERKIRGLIAELAGERHALLSTSERVTDTLRGLGSEVPALIEKLSLQQVKLAGIIDGAAQNLNSLETAITQTTQGLETSVNASTARLETTLGGNATRLQGILEDYTTGLGYALDARAQQIQTAFQHNVQQIESSLDQRTQAFGTTIETHTQRLQGAIADNMQAIDGSIGGHTQTLQAVLEEYTRALDTTLASRAQALDVQLVDRTRALDDAFSERLRLFDESILRSTMAIDGAISERSQALSMAMESHAKILSDTMGKQAHELDDTLMQGINSVRRTSEAITRQSIKAIEGLASQSEMLKSISENLLGQINAVTNRFENQGQAIMRAASTLEQANYKIDNTLQSRHGELSRTLDRLSGKADEFGEFVSGYSSSIAGSLTDAERRARELTDELKRGTQSRSAEALQEIERLKLTADTATQRTLEDLRAKFSSVTTEVSQQLGSLSNRVDATTEEVRQKAARAALELEQEQTKLKQQIDSLPRTTQESADAMRRSLQDQLRALQHLSSLTTREAQRRDVTPPAGAVVAPQPAPALAPPAAANPSDRSRQLSSLTATLAQEISSRRAPLAPEAQPSPPAAAAPQVAPPAAQLRSTPAAPASGREGWSLGDLLARASVDEENAPLAPAMGGGAPPTAPLQIDLIARALDPATASAIWQRLRSGQRGVMVRSLYSPDGRATFDDLVRRYGTEPRVREMVDQYMADFERVLRDAEQRDPTGRMALGYAASDTGRVYLFLAHASGRLA